VPLHNVALVLTICLALARPASTSSDAIEEKRARSADLKIGPRLTAPLVAVAGHLQLAQRYSPGNAV
jgi:hypothetical protein